MKKETSHFNESQQMDDCAHFLTENSSGRTSTALTQSDKRGTMDFLSNNPVLPSILRELSPQDIAKCRTLSSTFNSRIEKESRYLPKTNVHLSIKFVKIIDLKTTSKVAIDSTPVTYAIRLSLRRIGSNTLSNEQCIYICSSEILLPCYQKISPMWDRLFRNINGTQVFRHLIINKLQSSCQYSIQQVESYGHGLKTVFDHFLPLVQLKHLEMDETVNAQSTDDEVNSILAALNHISLTPTAITLTSISRIALQIARTAMSACTTMSVSGHMAQLTDLPSSGMNILMTCQHSISLDPIRMIIEEWTVGKREFKKFTIGSCHWWYISARMIQQVLSDFEGTVMNVQHKFETDKEQEIRLKLTRKGDDSCIFVDYYTINGIYPRSELMISNVETNRF